MVIFTSVSCPAKPNLMDPYLFNLQSLSHRRTCWLTRFVSPSRTPVPLLLSILQLLLLPRVFLLHLSRFLLVLLLNLPPLPFVRSRLSDPLVLLLLFLL